MCPSDPNCVAQCLDMFTWTSDSFNGRPVVMGNLKEPNHKNYFFCTRCNECINNFYDGLSLLNTPHQQTCPAPGSKYLYNFISSLDFHAVNPLPTTIK